MTYRDTLTTLADQSENQALTLFSQLDVLGAEMFAAMLAALIAQHNGRAAALAELALAAELMTQLRTPVPVAALPAATTAHYLDVERLRKAATTVLDAADTSEVPEAIVGRLARSEPLETAANTYSQAMRRAPLVKGWVRQLSPTACQLCRWWWREGRVWPAEHPMPVHKGCTCTPKPVLAEHIKSTGYTRRLRNAR
jgi:hypothetical protein